MLCQSVIPPVIKEEIHLTPCPCLPAWANCILTLDWISLQWTGFHYNGLGWTGIVKRELTKHGLEKVKCNETFPGNIS